jgi:hypothetical protein
VISSQKKAAVPVTKTKNIPSGEKSSHALAEIFFHVEAFKG